MCAFLTQRLFQKLGSTILLHFRIHTFGYILKKQTNKKKHCHNALLQAQWGVLKGTNKNVQNYYKLTI